MLENQLILLCFCLSLPCLSAFSVHSPFSLNCFLSSYCSSSSFISHLSFTLTNPMVSLLLSLFLSFSVRLLLLLYLAHGWRCPSAEKLIEGLKSPDTSSLLLPDLLSLNDPFGSSLEPPVDGKCAEHPWLLANCSVLICWSIVVWKSIVIILCAIPLTVLGEKHITEWI